MARQNLVRFPNESVDYRSARDRLLAEEIELRRHIERVAQQRRALPPGGSVPRNYAFVGESGTVSFSDLFGDKQTLAVYSYMYGPKRDQPCPMCTSLMAAWDGESLDVEQRIALVMVARSLGDIRWGDPVAGPRRPNDPWRRADEPGGFTCL